MRGLYKRDQGNKRELYLLQDSVCSDIIPFESGFKTLVGETVMNPALLIILCSLGIQEIEGRNRFSTFTCCWKFLKKS